MSKHTPGPWVLDEDAFLMGPGFYGVPRDGHDSYHSVRIPGVADMTGFCGNANARLIAAAPELLDALTKACNALYHLAFNIAREDGEGMTREGAAKYASAEWDTARAAISKAKGENEDAVHRGAK
jgi:hypothetical protein